MGNWRRRRNILLLKKLRVFTPFMFEAIKRFGNAAKVLERIGKEDEHMIDTMLIWDKTLQGWEFWHDKDRFFTNEIRKGFGSK